LQAATRRARVLAADRGVEITFSITTNGTLLTAEDAQFFEEHGFAVTISLDGPRAAHDAQRPFAAAARATTVIMGQTSRRSWHYSGGCRCRHA
jgi:uncharacterized protein